MSRLIRFLLTLSCLLALIDPASVVSAAPQPPPHSIRPYGPDRRPVPAAVPARAETATAAALAAPAQAEPVDNWSRIAYQSARDGSWEIFSMRPDGSELRRLTNDPAMDGWPQQSPADGRIVFVSDRSGNRDLYSMSADGSGLRRLTSDPAEDDYASWSPDGQRIVFASKRSGNWDIFVMNADGSNVVPLVTGPTTDWDPVWSPDGGSIAWVRAGEQTGRIWLAGVDGSAPHPISADEAYLENLAWSPDSKRIGFDYDYGGEGWTDIAEIRADGSSASPNMLQYSPAADTDAQMGGWAPDGSKLIMELVKYVVVENDIFIESTRLATKLPWEAAFRAPAVLPGSSLDRAPDWQRSDFIPPNTHLASPPALAPDTRLTVRWSGTDQGGSGITGYDLQYKIGNGAWTFAYDRPLPGPDYTFNFLAGSVVSFRVRGRDAAGNVEPWPPSPAGEGTSTIYAQRFTGYIYDVRETPIPHVIIGGAGWAPGLFMSAADGSYDVYAFSLYDTFELAGDAYGALPTIKLPYLGDGRFDAALPPKSNTVSNGGFEDGLADWTVSRPASFELRERDLVSIHSGERSLRLGEYGLPGPITQTLSQDIVVPPAEEKPTLSFFVHYGAGEPRVPPFTVRLTAPGGAPADLAPHMSDAGNNWSHGWADLSPWANKTVTLSFVVAVKAGETGRQAFLLDDVAVGGWHTPRILSAQGPNGTTGTITVKGENFESGAVVRLDDAALETTFVDSNTLTAALPSGVRPGLRALWVQNPGGEEALSALRVGRAVFLPITVKGD